MTYNYFIYAKDTGRISRLLYCNYDDVSGNLLTSESFGEGLALIDSQYVDVNTGALVDMPPTPGENYVFDYSTKAWVFDTAAATAAAMSKIDTLLAEGPDRISPPWWSAMSPATQTLWAQYRIDLLNVPNQPGFPKTIVWPTKPSVGT